MKERIQRVVVYSIGSFVTLIGFLASAIAVGALFTGDLPSYEYHLDCSDPLEERSAFGQAQEDIGSFHDFVAEYDGQVVYLSMEVYPSAMAGGCSLARGAWWNEGEDSAKTGYSLNYFDRALISELYSLDDDEKQQQVEFFEDDSLLGPQDARVGIVSEVNQESSGYTPSSYPGSWHPEWINLYLPDPDTIEGNGVYRTARSPLWYYLDGPFVVRLIRHRSVAAIHIAPLAESENYWREVVCSRKRLEWPFLRRLNPCW